MGRAFSDIAFTPTVRELQTKMGSRANYAPLDKATDRRDRLSEREAQYIGEADHFYQATVGESGWPYVQHRGGPAGFLKVLDDKTLGFADFRGNVQYVSVGNLATDDRIALILMDYANQRRLKILGRARTVEAAADPALIERLRMPGYDARIERAILIAIEAYDWNCPQHITPRFTEAEIDAAARPLRAELARMKDKLARVNAAATPEAFGNGPLALTITGVRQLTPRVRAYELSRADGAPLPEVAAGAHLDVPMRLADGTPTTRRYSIASDPGRRDAYEIAVLREDAGRGASMAVHDGFRLGIVLHCGVPGNDFALQDGDHPTVLIAGGIGITPIKVMAQTLQRAGRRYHLHYAVRSRREAAFAGQLHAELGERLTIHSAADGARLDVRRVVADAAPGSAFYVCGPERLIESAREAVRAAGFVAERFHAERFVAATARDDDQPVTITLEKSGKVIEVAAGTSILDAVQAAGVDAPASCRIGDCSTCAVRVLAGTPDHRDLALTRAEHEDEGLMCICVSRALTPGLTLDL
jgi:ferredoxin-NADP reductase/predicted pyridoxine 5'-phosphate oxidase superfamily flavin-nucleotide-binding protein